MTLAHSRHRYVEFVRDQAVATWLGCLRRAFEWFDGVPERVIIDSAKCAIIKACSHAPLVQRACGECAKAYGFQIDARPPHDPQKKGIVEAFSTSCWTIHQCQIRIFAEDSLRPAPDPLSNRASDAAAPSP